MVIHPGQMISKANDPIIHLHFLPRSWHEKSACMVGKCPGLYEALKGKGSYVESIFNGPQELTVNFIKTAVFQ